MADRDGLKVADAIEACDWSGVSIGNKAILQQAVLLLRTNAAAVEPATVPKGWKLVPLKLTSEMREAWDESPFDIDEHTEFLNAYSAMLAAAPSPAVAEPDRKAIDLSDVIAELKRMIASNANERARDDDETGSSYIEGKGDGLECAIEYLQGIQSKAIDAQGAEGRPDEYAAFEEWREKEGPLDNEVSKRDMARHGWLAGLRFADVYALPLPAATLGKAEVLAWMWVKHGWTITAHGKHRSINRHVDVSPPATSTINDPDFIELIPLIAHQPVAQLNIDQRALDLARSIMAIFKGPELVGGDTQMQAMIQCLLIDGLAAQQPAASDVRDEVANSLMWMYRRLINNYGRLPFVEQSIINMGGTLHHDTDLDSSKSNQEQSTNKEGE